MTQNLVRHFMVTVWNQKEYRAIVSLDIRNAFNSISWPTWARKHSYLKVSVDTSEVVFLESSAAVFLSDQFLAYYCRTLHAMEC